MKEDRIDKDWKEWQFELSIKLKPYKLIKPNIKLARELFNQGYSTKDAAGLIILNA